MALDENGKKFIAWLEEHRGAAVLNECGEQLPKITRGVAATAGLGKLVIELRFALEKDSEDEVVTADKVTPTIPESRRDVWFINEHGDLVRVRPRRRRPGDPQQTDLLDPEGRPDAYRVDLDPPRSPDDDEPPGDAGFGGRTPYKDD